MKKWKSSHTLRMIIRSYLLILLLPTVFGVMIHALAMQIVRTESDKAQMQMMNHVEDSVNYTLENMNSIIDAFLSDQAVNNLSNKTVYTKNDYQKMRNIQRDLLLTKLSNSYIDNILIYFSASDTVLSASYTLTRVSEMNGTVSLFSMEAEDFQSELEKADNFRFFIKESRGLKTPFVAHSNKSGTISGKPTVTIFISLTGDSLQNLMEADEAETFLFDSENDYFCTGRAESGSVDALLSENRSGRKYGPYRVLDMEGSLFSLRYIRLIPQKVYTRSTFRMQLLLFGYIALCLLAGTPMVASMVRKSYDPVRQILSILPDVSSPQDADDFRQIKESLTGLIQQNTQKEELLNKQDDAIRNYIMYKVIHEGEGYQKKFSENCDRLHLSFVHEDYMLIGIDIEDGSNLFFENPESVNQEMTRLVFFAISNLLSEKLGKEYPFFLAEYDGLLLILINTNEQYDANHIFHEMHTLCEEVYVRMENDFRAKLSLSISNIYKELSGVQKCYSEIQEILEYRSGGKTSPVLQYRDIRDYGPMAAIEKAAIREIRGHSYAAASSLLKEALRATNPQLEESMEAEPPSGKEVKSLTAILSYIDENYTDPNLSVSAIADKFGMAPSYLSLYFKRKMGVTLLEYIHSKRMKQVKVLLETDLPVKAIAKQTGYFDTRPMIRFFKRENGITPSEYRERLRSKQP